MYVTMCVVCMQIESICVHFASWKIAVTFLMIVQFQNFKDQLTRDACALLLVLLLEHYDARVRIWL